MSFVGRSQRARHTPKTVPPKLIEEQVRDNKIENVDFKFTPLTTTVVSQLAQALLLNHSVTSLDLWETR